MQALKDKRVSQLLRAALCVYLSDPHYHSPPSDFCQQCRYPNHTRVASTAARCLTTISQITRPSSQPKSQNSHTTSTKLLGSRRTALHWEASCSSTSYCRYGAIWSRRRAIVKKAVAKPQPVSQILEGSAGLMLQAESQILEGSAGQIPTNTTILPSSSPSSSVTVTEAAVHTPNMDHENTDKQLPGSEAVLETQRSIPDESSAPASKEVEAEACAESRLSTEAVMDKGKGREVDPGEPKHAVAAPNPRKRKSAPNEVQKRRKYGVQIPVINLDVEEGVEELKREALGEEDKDEALAVENAVKMLFRGEGRPHKETARRLLEKVMRVMKAEVVEVEED
ncbi:hypothetical protein L211DRAFT_853028 [Terfezia boudieri ATCC MYA-4762]|uniref:Uncharacterized protein n=1 Tax=Terfezia boudieri ATCC MYA-4762 TaxID=1051890 RepID=A0A3N4LAH8_9PEZI|nr:hypothetical protein L211DRAFT_853028 [Terfezia boudieri ATCC MYA-4762]